ncbi:MAG: hypothetical protein Q8Q08_04580 [Candidatus Omnitrophota bacterium]|nr:hypothetical protein [Candidatus Omnitrophota bacterium]MDZ4241365.1 hypothetical protein [Candidatus Omnitrophota bacterium]
MMWRIGKRNAKDCDGVLLVEATLTLVVLTVGIALTLRALSASLRTAAQMETRLSAAQKSEEIFLMNILKADSPGE